ncbi:MAG TPA: hypothetical protein VFM14_17960 [Gemmatimonadales bacterium]|nr:hypothetical protein [Gemmatimonadales bacterium]
MELGAGRAGWAYAALGRRSDALAVLDELREAAAHGYVPETYRAQVLQGLGGIDEAFAIYDRAYEQRSGWLVFLRATRCGTCCARTQGSANS